MIIKVKVKPSSNKEEVRKVDESNYEIDVKEKAKDNKANIRIINILSKEFKVDFRRIVIKNPKSREKIVEINVK